MNAPLQSFATRLAVPVDDLLQTALARLQRQKQYAVPLSRGGKRAVGLKDWLDQAASCITALAHPEYVLMPVTARTDPEGITLDNRVQIDGSDIADKISQGGKITAYLLTLGYSQMDAFDWLEHDYAAQHVQSDLASEVLFALGRHAQTVQHEMHPGLRLRRISVQVSDICGARRTWDPVRVQALLSVFDGINPGVSVTDTGCFQPLNSLLGLTLRY